MHEVCNVSGIEEKGSCFSQAAKSLTVAVLLPRSLRSLSINLKLSEQPEATVEDKNI